MTPPRTRARKTKKPSLKDYNRVVSVLVVAQVDEEDEHAVLPGNTLFWLHTYGMDHYGLPDLEVRDVPALWLCSAGDFLNGWATYMIREKAIKAGETLAGGLHGIVKVRAVASPDPWWGEREALRLVPEEVHHACAECGGHENTPEEQVN